MEEEICPICLESIKENNFVRLKCNHYIDLDCFMRMCNTSCGKRCPLCRQNLDIPEREVINQRPRLEYTIIDIPDIPVINRRQRLEHNIDIPDIPVINRRQENTIPVLRRNYIDMSNIIRNYNIPLQRTIYNSNYISYRVDRFINEPLKRRILLMCRNRFISVITITNEINSMYDNNHSEIEIRGYCNFLVSRDYMIRSGINYKTRSLVFA